MIIGSRIPQPGQNIVDDLRNARTLDQLDRRYSDAERCFKSIDQSYRHQRIQAELPKRTSWIHFLLYAQSLRRLLRYEGRQKLAPRDRRSVFQFGLEDSRVSRTVGIGRYRTNFLMQFAIKRRRICELLKKDWPLGYCDNRMHGVTADEQV